jgi:hypothetical protein
MLAGQYADHLADTLVPYGAWHPHPTIEDRTAWDGLLPALRAGHLERGEALLGYAWPSLPATLFLQYTRIGNRTNYEKSSFERRSALASLTLAECTEGEGRFLDDIVNGIWAICEESYWGVPSHIWFQSADNTLPDTGEPTVDLFAAETGSLLSWVSYLLGERLDTVSTLVRPRIHREVERRVIEVCLRREDFVWMGFIDRGKPVNNWNPWVSSNWLTAVLLEESNPERRLASVSKILRTLDHFIRPYPRDGGCDEGPSYWGRAGASLFDCLEILRSATDGAIDLYDEPLIQKMGQFIYRVQIDGSYYINFADASAMVDPDALLVYRYGQQIGDEEMMAFGRWLLEDQKLDETGIVYGTGRVVAPSLGRVLPAIFTMDEALKTESRKPLPRDVWLEEVQVFAARDVDGSSQGLYVAAKGGHNEESHNHNDIGNFIVYVDGLPLLVDAGVESYTSKTFSDRRYEIWTMQSGYHSLLPTIDGLMQEAGRQFAAKDAVYSMDDGSACVTLDIADAYPETSIIQKWQRTITLNRGKDVVISDDYELSHSSDEIVLSLITPCAVDLSTSGKIILSEAEFNGGYLTAVGSVSYDAGIFTVSSEMIPITDERMGGIWGESLVRVVLTAESPPAKGEWQFRVTPNPAT